MARLPSDGGDAFFSRNAPHRSVVREILGIETLDRRVGVPVNLTRRPWFPALPNDEAHPVELSLTP